MRRCALCSCWEYAGAPGCRRCRDLVDALVEPAWQDFRREFAGIGEVDLAGIVAEEVPRHDWRVVDAAFEPGLRSLSASGQSLRRGECP